MANATFINSGQHNLHLNGVVNSNFSALNGEGASISAHNTYNQIEIHGGNRLTFLSCNMGDSTNSNKPQYCYHDNSNNNTFIGCTGAGAATTVWSTGGSSRYSKCAGTGLATNQGPGDDWQNGRMMIGAGAVSLLSGTGAPTVAAAAGSIYLRTDGSSGSRVYVNQNGSTTWTAISGV
jgi:hypothetical protein